MSKFPDFRPNGTWAEHHNDNDARWRAVITYQSDAGVAIETHHFEEIAELHNIIERGPDWNTMVSCVVTLSAKAAGAS